MSEDIIKVNSSPKNKKYNKKYVILEIRTTSMPDIYELYHKNNGNRLEMNSYASIPNDKNADILEKYSRKKILIMTVKCQQKVKYQIMKNVII